MVDDTTKVEISKRDITSDTELAGATLQVIDKDGIVIEEWVSTNESHIIEAKLIAGKTYTLRETTAPEGYTIANEIQFTVNEDGSMTSVVMYDEPIPDVPDTPTGDTANRLPGVLLIAAGLIMLAAAGMNRKKKDSNADEYAALCPDFIEKED